MESLQRVFLFFLLVLQIACDDEPPRKPLLLTSAEIGASALSEHSIADDVAVNQLIILRFSSSLKIETINEAITLSGDQHTVPVSFSLADGDRTVQIDPTDHLLTNTAYSLVITDALTGVKGERFAGATFAFRTFPGELKVLRWTLGGEMHQSDPVTEIPLDIDLTIHFNKPLRSQSVDAGTISLSGPDAPGLVFDLSPDKMTVNITSSSKLVDLAKYKLVVNSQLQGEQNEEFTGFEIDFYTRVDTDPDFPIITEAELLTRVQQQTFKYFWEFAHPASGMARERNTSGDIVTTGGSGFGIMSLIVGIERGFITREQGLERLEKILTFLEEADRFHGVWPHWLNGNTGDVVPFSANDNGGDLVETSFLVQGLLAFRQYLDEKESSDLALINRINSLWEAVEWNWFTREGQKVLYWHWSPDKQWTMNHPIRGYNEALITYLLAASSPTHPIDGSVYHEGWANNGAIINNKEYLGFALPVGSDYGGPLFFAHYSFLGLDPRNLSDSYANYWTQNVNHSRINHAYSVSNPKNFVGYSAENWGLTASDDQGGYSAHSPVNDLGVITPTAAISSFPYTPAESMKALEFFYYKLGDRLWGPYGFYDAFNITGNWTADSYLAIDQGPIVIMIENYRSALLWNLFMSAPEIERGLSKLGFTR